MDPNFSDFLMFFFFAWFIRTNNNYLRPHNMFLVCFSTDVQEIHVAKEPFENFEKLVKKSKDSAHHLLPKRPQHMEPPDAEPFKGLAFAP